MKCTDKKIGKLIFLYEFDKLNQGQRKAFEAHLLECDYCFQNLYTLSPVVKKMRENPQAFLPALSVPERIPFRKKVRALWDKLVPDISGIPVTVLKPVRIAVPVVAAIIAAVLIITGPTNDYSDLARIEPIRYIPVALRGGVEMTKTDILFDQGMELYGAGKYNQAIHKLSQTVSRMPKSADAHFYLGLCYLLTQEADSSIVHFIKAIEFGNNSLLEKCHWYLGNAYLLKNDEEKALEEFRKVLELKGDWWFDAQDMVKEIEARIGK